MTKQLSNPAEFLSQPKKARTAPKAKPSTAAKQELSPEAKKARTAPKAKQEQPAPVATSNLAAQLAAAAPASAVAAPYNLDKCPECGSEEIYTGRVDKNGIVQDEQLVGGCHNCDWTYDVRSAKSRKAAPNLKLVLIKEFKPRTNHIADGDKGNFAQRANWDALVQAIQEHGGAITYAEAVAAVEAAGKAGGYGKTCNARGFVQGRIRNGHVKAA